jgi:hypothetical protein
MPGGFEYDPEPLPAADALIAAEFWVAAAALAEFCTDIPIAFAFPPP